MLNSDKQNKKFIYLFYKKYYSDDIFNMSYIDNINCDLS